MDDKTRSTRYCFILLLAYMSGEMTFGEVTNTADNMLDNGTILSSDYNRLNARLIAEEGKKWKL